MKIVLPNMSSVKLLKIQQVYIHVKQETMLAQLKHLASWKYKVVYTTNFMTNRLIFLAYEWSLFASFCWYVTLLQNFKITVLL